MTIRIRDLPVDVLLQTFKEEIKKNKEHDKTGVATVILVSIYNALSESYIKVVNDLKKKNVGL